MNWLRRLLNARDTAARRARVRDSVRGRHAADLLRAPTALATLDRTDALTVVAFMALRRYRAGEAIIREGADGDGGFLALVVEGEVTVESHLISRAEPLTMSVLGPGQVIGEVALFDGDARSASCTASTPQVVCALLTREALQTLMAREPATAAKLLAAVGQRLGGRLREVDGKLKFYSQLVQSLQQEIDRLMPD